MNTQILGVKSLGKKVISNGSTLNILHSCDFEINSGDTVAIIGRSGSGKSTLLSLLAGLDSTSIGEIWLSGHPLHEFDEEARAELRAKYVGFVFQSFMLVQSLTALENVMLPLELSLQDDAKQQAEKLLTAVGLIDRATHYPNQLSGGEQQRVAIARAFASRPAILFADEPTGNLDAENGAIVESLLFELNQAQGTTLVIVTHDPKLAQRCQRQFTIEGGQISETSIIEKDESSSEANHVV